MYKTKTKAKKAKTAQKRKVMQTKKASKPYYVSYEVSGKLGKTKGRKEFASFQSAQNFAVRVHEQKTARLISWGPKKAKR